MRGLFRPTLTLLVSAAFFAHGISTARAAPPPASAERPPKITPPVATSDTNVPYPEGASGDAIVLLVLEIDAGGRVTSAVVTDGAEPFAAKARAAVLGWTFSPARRGEQPIASRIRARVEFHQEVEPTASPTSSTAPPTPTALPHPPTSITMAEPEEVFVRGTRHENGVTTISADDVREMPGAFGDPFRAVEALPGVVPVVSGLPFFYIRGAPPTDNLYSIDGIKVPILFHVGIGEAVVHPALIDKIDFYPGAAPARYGHAAGAIIDGETRAPAEKPHGQVDLRLIDAGALVESPFADDKATALVAARYGYPGPILSAVTDTVKLGYWDYQTRATLKTSDRDTLGVFAFGSHDYLGTASTRNGVSGPISDAYIGDFHRVDLRYDRRLTGGRLRVAATFGYDSMGGALDSGDADTMVKNLSFGSRLEIEKEVSKSVRLRGGADVQLDHWTFEQGAAPLSTDGTTPSPQVPSSANPPPTDLTWGAHADVVWKLGDRVEIVPGLRFDVFDSMRENPPAGARGNTMVPALDPRLSTRVRISSHVAWISSFGVSHQYPVLRVGDLPAMLVSVPGFPTNGSTLQTAAQASQGVEVALPLDFTLTTTAFLSGRTGLTDLTSRCQQLDPAVQMPSTTPDRSPPPVVCPNDSPVNQRAFGVELLLRRPLTKRLSGWISYTLSRASGEEHFLTATGGTAVATVVNDYDRTHVLNAILGYDLGRRWRVGGRFLLLSGTAFSNLSGNVPIAPYNDQRNPFFYRIDLRLEKKWPFLKTGTFAFIAEVQNVTLNKETTSFGEDCQGTATAQGGTNQCTEAEIGPIVIPSIGVEASF